MEYGITYTPIIHIIECFLKVHKEHMQVCIPSSGLFYDVEKHKYLFDSPSPFPKACLFLV